MYTVSVASSAQTADGNPLAQELSYSFTTFDYSELVDDTTFTDGELFGIAYHPGTDSIYFDGANDAQDDFFIRRYDVASGVVGTVAPPDVSFQVMYGGVDVYGDTLYLNKTYDGEVAEYDIQSDGSLVANGTTYASPTLSAPADDLSNVADTAVLGDTRYFVTSQYAGTPFTDIIAYNSPGDSWSVFADATTHGFDSGTRRAITAVDGTSFDYVYLFDNESSTLFRFAVGGGSFSTDVGISVSDVDLDHDSDGNIYVGTSVGLYQFSPDLALLEVREWAPASRITIKEIGDTVRVFLAYAGAPARIWYTDF